MAAAKMSALESSVAPIALVDVPDPTNEQVSARLLASRIALSVSLTHHSVRSTDVVQDWRCCHRVSSGIHFHWKRWPQSALPLKLEHTKSALDAFVC